MNITFNRKHASHVNHVLRSVFDVLFMILIIVAPWWLALPVGLGVLFFLGAYEVVLGGIFMDMLYASSEHHFGATDLLFTTLFLVAMALAYGVRQVAKTHLRM